MLNALTRRPIDLDPGFLGLQFQVAQTGARNAVRRPAVNGRDRSIDHLCDFRYSTEGIDDFAGIAHSLTIPIIGATAQAKRSDNGNCDYRKAGLHGRVDISAIKARMRELGIKQVDLARHLGLVPNKITKSFSGERRFTVQEMDKIRELLRGDPAEHDVAPLRAIPVIGQVAAGNWREAIRQPLSSMPQPDPSIPARAFALRVAGDSMDLLVDDGGVVIVDPEDKDLYSGRYFVVINADGETTFKRFEANPARLVPCSTNVEHQPISIGSGEDFEVLGRVIWRAAKM